jgi:hypothetical protein
VRAKAEIEPGDSLNSLNADLRRADFFGRLCRLSTTCDNTSAFDGRDGKANRHLDLLLLNMQ